MCATNEEAVECLQALIAPGDFILIKGSRGMQMEYIVSRLSKG
jgi:UDP-N-acetylmuramyl pentapeptide synthase